MSTSISLGSLEDPLVPQASVVKRARTEDGVITTKSEPIDDVTNRVRIRVKRNVEDVAKENPLVYKPTEVGGGVVKVETVAVGSSEGPVSLVAVRGNNKVMRCPRCNTFVKAGSEHPITECNARIQRKASGRASAASGSFLRKRIRLTPKRRSTLETMVLHATKYDALVKLAPRIEKWITKKEKKLTKPSKKLFASLLSALQAKPDMKKLKTNFRKAGLVK